MTIKCKKDLVSQAGEHCFTKGQEYKVINQYPTYLHDNIRVIDDTDTEHWLGSWFVNFKIVKQ